MRHGASESRVGRHHPSCSSRLLTLAHTLFVASWISGCSDRRILGPSAALSGQSAQQHLASVPDNLVAVTRFFAPVIHQLVADEFGWRGDMLTKVTYDGDWLAVNN